jgi:hypothetical protein
MSGYPKRLNFETQDKFDNEYLTAKHGYDMLLFVGKYKQPGVVRSIAER